MEFGFFAQVFVPDDEAERTEGYEQRRLLENLELSVMTEEFGFKYVWASEHHFLRQYSHMSSPEVFLSFVASRTSRIHVGSAIFNITAPVNHPVRSAERAAMLDNLSGGRFELGTGRGSSSTEMHGFGIAEMDQSKDLWDEAIREIPKMWREGTYEYSGQSFSVPPREIFPKPVAKPHPPLWVAAGNPGTFEKAARLGLGVLCFTTGSPETLKPLIEVYKNTIDQAEPVGEYVNNNVMVTSQMLCLEDGQRARDIACSMNGSYQNSLVFHYLDTFPKPPGLPAWPDLIPEPTPETLQLGIDTHQVMIGTPDEVRPAVEAYEGAGADQVVFGMLSTTMPVEVAIEAVETFGAQVIPQFDRDLVHSTTRQREAHRRGVPHRLEVEEGELPPLRI